MRVENKVLRQVECVVILDDAAYLNVRKREGFRHVLQSLRLQNGLVERLPNESGNRTIGAHGSGMNIYNVVSIFFVEGDLYIGVLTAFVFQYLDANIVVLMSAMAAVVAIHLPVQNNGRCPCRLWLTGHREFFGRDWLESFSFDLNGIAAHD